MRRAERSFREEAEPAAGAGVYFVRGLFELGRGRDADALTALLAGQRLARQLASPSYIVPRTKALLLHALVRLGETERAEQALAELDEWNRERGELRIATAALRLAQDDPRAALAALAPVLDGTSPLIWPTWLTQAFLLEATARDALGDPAAAGRALETALDRAEPDGVLLWFLLHPAPGLLERHARQRTAHGALVAEMQGLLAGRKRACQPARPRPPFEPLSNSELRVLRYLPANLTAPEIAGELSVSVNTVRTHVRNVYAKLGTHRRAEAVARGRDLGLLAPSARHRTERSDPC